MTRASSLCLVAFLTLGTAAQNAPGVVEPTLQTGIKQFEGGDLAGAVFTLEAVIRTLSAESPLPAKELSQAYLYRGAAFVGLGHEENAKGSFAAALRYDKDLRVSEDKFSPRVVRVFVAARTGKTKSVLLPPSKVAKKAGISALGIAGIVAGAAAIGGGVAAATSSTPPTPIPTTTTTTTLPPLPTTVSLVSLTGPGQIYFLNSSPPPGGTVTGCGAGVQNCSITMAFTVFAENGQISRHQFVVVLDTDSGSCVFSNTVRGQQGYELVGTGPRGVTLELLGTSACPTSTVTLTRMRADLVSCCASLPDIESRWTVAYRLVP